MGIRGQLRRVINRLRIWYKALVYSHSVKRATISASQPHDSFLALRRKARTRSAELIAWAPWAMVVRIRWQEVSDA
jgi:hypothetical protein